tara:strand:+ start:656 stop:982 length:327 start_codon:yes stop_codon:yes gene_type:complete
MSQVFNCIDLRRKIFNFKSASLKQEAKKNYDIVLKDLNRHLYMPWDGRNDWDLPYEDDTLTEEQVYNFSQNEFHNYMISRNEINKKLYGSPPWSVILLGNIVEEYTEP